MLLVRSPQCFVGVGVKVVVGVGWGGTDMDGQELGKVSGVDRVRKHLGKVPGVDRIRKHLGKVPGVDRIRKHLGKVPGVDRIRKHLGKVPGVDRVRKHLGKVFGQVQRLQGPCFQCTVKFIFEWTLFLTMLHCSSGELSPWYIRLTVPEDGQQ